MKVDKETIAEITKAVELFMATDYDARERQWTAMSERMAAAVEQSGKAAVRLGYPQEPGIQPVNILRVYIAPRRKTAAQVHEALLKMTPQIYAGLSGGELVLNPQCLGEEEVQAVIDGMIAAL